MWRRDQRTSPAHGQPTLHPQRPTGLRYSLAQIPLLLSVVICGIETLTMPIFLAADEPAVVDQVATDSPNESSNESSNESPNDLTTNNSSENSEGNQAGEPQEPAFEEQAVEKQTIAIPDHWKRLGKPGGSEVWLDIKNKSVIVAGHICLTRGGLEMFVCPINTKEHESVIAAHATAAEVHAALLAIGAKPGKPVQWEPIQKSASGSIIEVRVTWLDPESNRPMTRWGKEMVRDFRDGTGLSHDWVFGGSILEKDPDSDETYYYADSGPLLCVSNFATACIDINVPSSAADGNLLYEANTPNLPAKGTKVYIRLTPKTFYAGE